MTDFNNIMRSQQMAQQTALGYAGIQQRASEQGNQLIASTVPSAVDTYATAMQARLAKRQTESSLRLQEAVAEEQFHKNKLSRMLMMDQADISRQKVEQEGLMTERMRMEINNMRQEGPREAAKLRSAWQEKLLNKGYYIDNGELKMLPGDERELQIKEGELGVRQRGVAVDEGRLKVDTVKAQSEIEERKQKAESAAERMKLERDKQAIERRDLELRELDAKSKHEATLIREFADAFSSQGFWSDPDAAKAAAAYFTSKGLPYTPQDKEAVRRIQERVQKIESMISWPEDLQPLKREVARKLADPVIMQKAIKAYRSRLPTKEMTDAEIQEDIMWKISASGPDGQALVRGLLEMK